MNKFKKIQDLRLKLTSYRPSIGSWMQIPNASVAEIMGASGYDWVAIDLEHGSFSTHQLPDLFRALELGNTLPFVRVAESSPKDCKQALDAGAAGIILPNINDANELSLIIKECKWPPAGTRGVGFSRTNLFGLNFESYAKEGRSTFIVAMIESNSAVKNLDSILTTPGLDAILIGPYDLSASLGITGDFRSEQFIRVMDHIQKSCEKYKIPAGIHVVDPDLLNLNKRIEENFLFIAYSIDSVFLSKSCKFKLEV